MVPHLRRGFPSGESREGGGGGHTVVAVRRRSNRTRTYQCTAVFDQRGVSEAA